MRLKRCLFCSALFAAGTFQILSAGQSADVLQDPVTLGAWLYRSKCTRCHGEYESSRVGENYDEPSELIQAMSGGGCNVNWSRIGGGPLASKDLKGLAAYMMIWEEEDEEPKLPELPPLQPDEAAPIIEKEIQDPVNTEESAESQELPPELTHLLASNSVVRGGWLYTNNCYRCHLTYQQARIGKGLEFDTVYRTISEGKTSTQMTPFSRMLGGNLKSDEIRSIADYIISSEKAGEPLAIAPVLMTPPAQDPADFVPLRLTRYKPITGDSRAGAVLYTMNCRACHGTRGEGHIGSSLRDVKPSLRPDLFYKSVIKQGIPGSLMISWEQARGGRLTAKDIDDLVSFIKLWEVQKDNEIFTHHGLDACENCHDRPRDHRQGKCKFCHDTVDWGHAS